MEVAGFALAVIPLFIGALESTQYAIDSVTRSYVPENNLKRYVQETKQSLETHNDGLEQLHKLSKSCKRLISQHSDVLAQYRQCSRSKRSLERMALKSDVEGDQDPRRFEESCAELLSCWQSDNIRVEPIFWRLQRWIMRSGEKLLLHLRIRLPKTIQQPSATTLLVSWLVIALATLAYYELHEGHRYRKHVLLGSAGVAVIIGLIERSNTDTVILTNIPWCLTLSILLDSVVRGFSSGRSRSPAREGSATRKEQYCDKEKTVLP